MEYNYKVLKGDTWDGARFTITKNESPLDLSGATIKVEYKLNSKTGFTKRTISIGTGITLIDAPNGVFDIDGFIVDLDVGRYFYDIEITLSGEVKTYVEGVMTVLQDVTNG